MANALKAPGPSIKAGSGFLHQMLHGYAEGHRLLENSITVPDDLTRLMLRMSDLSGSNMSRGFEEYITGYPLTSLQAYALAKTWYAPEMPRPGCVWTHTIVIPASAMAQIPSLGALRLLFKRPSEHARSGIYANPIPLELALHATPFQPLPKEPSQEMQTLLSLHYGEENNSVVLAAHNSMEFEDVIFAVWSQKWPNLRMGFTFCTGSLSARNLGKRPFDVQCVPTSMTREVLLEIAGAGIAEPVVMNSVSFDTPSWAVLAAADASRYGGGEVRNFLWRVSDASSRPAEFASFMAVFEALHQSPTLPTLITLVAKLFPQPNAGQHLKCLLLNSEPSQGLLHDQREQDVLFAIATTADYQSFDAESLLIKERGARLCVGKLDAACWLVGELFRSTLNPLGEELLAGLISAMNTETARQVTTEQPQFLPALFRAKPGLASSPQLWLAAGDRRRELFESVAAHTNLDSALVAGVVNALLESGSEVFIRRALDLWGRDAVFQTLDWTEAHNGMMSETCRGALTYHLPAVMDWTEARPTRSFESLITVAHVVAPSSYQLLQYDSTVWVRTFHHLQGSIKEEEASYICTFLLALAFGNAPPSPLELLSESFERVHESARRERLSDSAWLIMEPLVPELSWLSNWDKCERLRRGLISAFLRHKWPASELRQRIKDDELLLHLLRSAKRVEGGEKFFRGF
jgi:hypothetical protein